MFSRLSLAALAGAPLVAQAQNTASNFLTNYPYLSQSLPGLSQTASLQKTESFYSGATVGVPPSGSSIGLTTVSTPNIVIPIIGDIGRTGGLASINQGNPGCPLTLGGSNTPGLSYFGFPASVLDPGATYGGASSTDDDLIGSFEAYQTAKILDDTCHALNAANTPCNAILNTGDKCVPACAGWECAAGSALRPQSKGEGGGAVSLAHLTPPPPASTSAALMTTVRAARRSTLAPQL